MELIGSGLTCETSMIESWILRHWAFLIHASIHWKNNYYIKIWNHMLTICATINGAYTKPQVSRYPLMSNFAYTCQKKIMCFSDRAKQLRVLTKSDHKWHHAMCHINCRITPLKTVIDFWGGGWCGRCKESKKIPLEWIINRSQRKAKSRNKRLDYF